MGDRVFLKVETRKGDIMIPFLGLREVDYFTVGYENEVELINSLCEMLNLAVSLDDVIKVSIYGDKYKNTGNSSLDCLKFRDDNYNADSVKEMLSFYLRQDHRRIKYCDVRHVNTDEMVKFKGGKTISDRGINLAVKAFMNGDYKKQRDMYFLIKGFGGIRIEKLSGEEIVDYRKNLAYAEAEEDDFYQYLVELASKGEEEFEKAMDELSKNDLEDISRMLGTNDVVLFDGVNTKNGMTEDMYALEALTGMRIDSLKKLLADFCNDYLSEYEVRLGHIR